MARTGAVPLRGDDAGGQRRSQGASPRADLLGPGAGPRHHRRYRVHHCAVPQGTAAIWCPSRWRCSERRRSGRARSSRWSCVSTPRAGNDERMGLRQPDAQVIAVKLVVTWDTAHHPGSPWGVGDRSAYSPMRADSVEVLPESASGAVRVDGRARRRRQERIRRSHMVGAARLHRAVIVSAEPLFSWRLVPILCRGCR